MNEQSIKKKMYAVCLCICFALFAGELCAQGVRTRLADSFHVAVLDADSVWIANHRSLEYLSREGGRDRVLRKQVLKSGLPDTTLILQRQSITPSERQELIQLFAETPDRIQRVGNMCFDPHYAVFIFKNGQTRFIDICFACLAMQTSPGILLQKPGNDGNWNRLENWFHYKGLGDVPNNKNSGGSFRY